MPAFLRYRDNSGGLFFKFTLQNMCPLAHETVCIQTWPYANIVAL